MNTLMRLCVRLSVVAFLLSLLIALANPAAAQTEAGKKPAEDGKLDLVIKGELKPDDPKDRVTKQPSKVHEVKLKGGQAYVIALDAVDKGWDLFLRVEDAAGKELAHDDDGGGFPNARILFQAPMDAQYRVIATAYEGAGKYVVRVRAGKLSEVEKLAE